MKKLLLCIMVLFAAVALTGCNKKENNNNNGETTTTAAAEKKLQCSASVGDISYRITLTYTGDNVSKAVIALTEKNSSEAAAKKSYEDGKSELADVNKNKGVNASIQQSGTLVTGTYSFTIADMDDGAKALYDELFEGIKDKSYDDVNSSLTAAGYTCK